MDQRGIAVRHAIAGTRPERGGGRGRIWRAIAALVAVATGGAAERAGESAEEFARRPEVQARVDFERFDPALMSAAIFHETNRVRRRLGLPPFEHQPALDRAADLKAAVGVVQGELTHDNPLPLTAQPADRVRAVGLSYRVVAENIARVSLLDLPPGTREVIVRARPGRTLWLNPATRQPVEMLSYAGFAERVLASWMESPGHRANIVNPELVALGTATRPCRSLVAGHEQVYAVQVFIAP